jgi:glutaredoxin
MITVFGKDGCVQCDQAVKLLQSAAVDYKYVKVLYPGNSYAGDSVQLEDFKQQYPTVRAMPFIMRGDSVIGGLADLRKVI